MARLSDHDQRDAEHVLRSEITLVLARYARRMAEKGKAYITEAIAQSIKEGKDIDGSTIGHIAAERVKAEYFATTSRPEPAIDTTATSSASTNSDRTTAIIPSSAKSTNANRHAKNRKNP